MTTVEANIDHEQHVNYTGYMSAERAGRETGSYRQCVLFLCAEHGIPVTLCGRVHMIRQADMPRIRQLVAEWLERPRVTRAGLGRRRGAGGRGGGVRGPATPASAQACA